MSEFDLIKRFFYWDSDDAQQTVGNGDDAAVLSIPEGYELAVSVDTSNVNVHFPEETPAFAVGHKSLAVNLSDMAAMGATPRWFTLSLSLPEYDEVWLSEFSNGLKQLAQKHNVHLIGGDTTRGPLSISIQIMGVIPKGKARLRSQAREGDLVCVTGTLGDAAAGLAVIQERLFLPKNKADHCIQQLNFPTPRNDLSHFLIQHAHACMDLSDGLLGDVKHIAKASDVGVIIDAEKLPLSPVLKQLDTQQAYEWALAGGDDYELLFTIPADKKDVLSSQIKQLNVSITVIGSITKKIKGVSIQNLDAFQISGYDHFS